MSDNKFITRRRVELIMRRASEDEEAGAMAWRFSRVVEVDSRTLEVEKCQVFPVVDAERAINRKPRDRS